MENEKYVNKINSDNFQRIVEAIDEGTCIVVLGTELCSLKVNILQDRQQPKDFDEAIKLAYPYYLNYLNESKSNLINFEDDSFNKENLWMYHHVDETHLFDFARWFFERTEGWQKPFSKLAEMPLPLIISLLPDKHLEQTFKEQNQSFYVSHYSRVNEPNVDDNIVKLDKSKTLIYKLLGDLKKNDATFTFEHWFDFFHQIFKEDPPLPDKIVNALQKADVILFLGVKIEKWYVQLLVKLLYSTGSKNKIHRATKYAVRNKYEKNEIPSASHRLNIIFDDKNPEELINQLHDALRAKNLLRVLKETSPKINTKVFISYNHADKALADKLKVDLEKIGIEIIIDSDNPIGFDIPTFINQSINKAEFVLQLISENFLTSAWVAQESIKAFTLAEITGKVVLPCDIDEVLNKSEFRTQAMHKFESQLGNLKTEIGERLDKGESFEDLQAQYQRILELKNNYDKTIAEFRKKNRGDLRGNNYENGLKQIISSIKTYQAGNV